MTVILYIIYSSNFIIIADWPVPSWHLAKPTKTKGQALISYAPSDNSPYVVWYTLLIALFDKGTYLTTC